MVRNNSAKFQLYPPNSFWGVDFWIFFLKFCLFVAMVTNQIKKLQQKKVCFVEDHLRNISVKLLSKYLQWDSSKCQFSFFPIICQVAIATRVLIRLGQKIILLLIPTYRCYAWNIARISFVTAEEMFENVDNDRLTVTDACLYYKLTYEPSAQVRWAKKSHVWPAKTQISLCSYAVRPEFFLGPPWKANNPMLLHADSKDWSGCAGWSESLPCSHHFVGFVMLWLK